MLNRYDHTFSEIREPPNFSEFIQNYLQIRKNSKVIIKQVSERKKSDYDDLLVSESITDLQIKYGRIKQLECENLQLKNALKQRDEEINELRREIDKLKVLPTHDLVYIVQLINWIIMSCFASILAECFASYV